MAGLIGSPTPPDPKSQERYQEIKHTYFRLELHFSDMIDAANTEEERENIRGALNIAEHAFLQASADRLTNNTPLVEKTLEELKKANTKLKELLDDQKKFAEAINVAVTAADTALKLVGLALKAVA
jgi:hypothetical protein